MSKGSRAVIYAGLAANVAVAIAKFVAAGITHSSAMLSEAIHSLVDSLNEVVMLWGMRQASRPADARHPLGHGRELYFWSFVVSVLIFSLGAGVSVYEGVRHILDPHPIESPMINYGVLAFAALVEGLSWRVAFREFRARKGDLGYFEAAQKTKDPTTLTVFLEDTAALIGIALAFAGTLATQVFDAPVFDGMASIAIGLLLAVVAIFLAIETKRLLIGESARGHVVAAVRAAAEGSEGVVQVNGLFTIQLSPRQVVVALSIEFADSLRTPQIEAAVEDIEARVRKAKPEVMMVLVKPQTAKAYADALRRREGTPPPA
ncbi:MAG TPA: cation diffusion facilitator family transporter [Usitatibacter sp.]|nr:cation diffusion facilitator family transporter [Usitatibacter sp.]